MYGSLSRLVWAAPFARLVPRQQIIRVAFAGRSVSDAIQTFQWRSVLQGRMETDRDTMCWGLAVLCAFSLPPSLLCLRPAFAPFRAPGPGSKGLRLSVPCRRLLQQHFAAGLRKNTSSVIGGEQERCTLRHALMTCKLWMCLVGPCAAVSDV